MCFDSWGFLEIPARLLRLVWSTFWFFNGRVREGKGCNLWIVIAPTLSSAGPSLVQVGLPGAKSKLHSIRWTAVHSGKLLQVRENIWSFAFSCRDFAIFSLLFVISFSARQPRRATQMVCSGTAENRQMLGRAWTFGMDAGRALREGKRNVERDSTGIPTQETLTTFCE